MDSPLQRILPNAAPPVVQPKKRRQQGKGGSARFSLDVSPEPPPPETEEPEPTDRSARRAQDGETGGLLDVTA